MSDTLNAQEKVVAMPATGSTTADSKPTTSDVANEILEAKDIASHLSNIQGNIIGGFSKDYQTALFLRFSDPHLARTWLASIISDVATSSEVVAFNELFKETRKRRNGREGTVKSTWMNIAFTFHGFQGLGRPAAELDSFPDDFKQGMKARHDVAIFPGLTLGDIGASDPQHWIEPFKSSLVDAVMLIASDSQNDLNSEIAFQTQNFNKGVHLVFRQDGQARAGDQRGHEHFGFKDGISQPAIKGVDEPDDPVNNPNQGHPGQDMLEPGEFLLGYRRQSGRSGSNHDVPDPVPDWMKDGSYLVFRRLRQNVRAFHDFVTSQAKTEAITEKEMGAKLVGRFDSGQPLERVKIVPPNTDPLADQNINNFEYENDPDGKLVPRSAHIRKVYPRNEPVPGGGFGPESEADTQTHRLLRRGIPYGASLQDNALAGSPGGADADRGLLFLAYQHSIRDQFEFIQAVWVNNPNFPGQKDNPNHIVDGQDPIIAQKADPREFNLPGGKQVHFNIRQWITTTGGDYFLQPSIYGLQHLAEQD
ncbi:MAG: peroxidase [Ktedonobacteraceae bacterium]